MTDEIKKRLERLSPAQRRLLERRIAEQRRGSPAGELAPVPGEGPFPLSFAQERFWFLERLDPGDPAHHLPGIARFTGPLDAGAFKAAMELVVERHAVLRSVYEDGPDGPVQRVLPAGALTLEPVDLRGLPPSERESERVRIEERMVRAPFDLARGPLLRLALLQLADGVHQLVTSLHHIAADGLSMQLLGDELARAYSALVEGREPDLPALPVQYKDYAVWQRRHLAGAHLEQGTAWWEERLRGVAELALPADRPRRDAPRGLGRREGLDLAPRLGARLRALARAEQTTLFTVLLAAFQALLQRWSGERDVAVGTTAANRGRAELERLVGFFVNTLVLRTDLGGNPSFRELVRRVAATSLAAQDHQEVPFERVVDALQPERRLDRNPLFQAMFNYVEFQGWTRPLGGGVSMDYRLAQAGTLFDLTLYATVHGEAVGLELEYDASLFDASTVQRLLLHLETFLYTVAADPEARVGTLGILPPEERRRLAAFGAGPRVEPRGPEELCVHLCYAALARAHPERPSVKDGERTLTYGEVEAAANRLARELSAAGVARGARVGVALPRGAALLPALLGIAKAGAAWVPLDPRLPEARRAHIERDAGLARVIAALDLDGTEDPGPPPVAVAPENEAYVLYTSGSTGVPKGVRVPHRALARFLDAVARTPGLGADDVLLAVTTLSFDISLLELLGPALAGGLVRVASAEDAADGARLMRLLDREGITVMQATPATWRLLLLGGWRGTPGLRVLCGGEALPRDLADELLATGADVWNLYGPTETTVWSAADRVSGAPIALGRPLPGERARVADEHDGDAPIGVPGELVLGGEGVALGYTRPELDAGRFVAGRDGARWYRTGDVARFGADGRLFFLGRRDDQVKLRGFRIELGDVEAALRAHPGVRDAACALRDERLVGYCVPAQPDAPPLPEALRAHLAARLPDYMLPAALVVLDALPLSPAGKVDRRALPAPERAAPVAPARAGTETEAALQAIWADALGLDEVGLDEDFFDLGGHSLLAARLAARIRDRLGADVPLRAFFSAPTIAALAPLVEAARASGARPSLPAPGPRPRHVPLTFHQERLWFLEQLEEGPSAYHMAGALRLAGPLDADALGRALTEVVRRHEVLRTVFRAQDAGGTPEQVVEPPGAFALGRADLAQALDPEAAWRAHAARVAGEPFDLGVGPLFRAALLCLGPTEHVLAVCMHHVVSDGWSLGVLAREVSLLYAAFRAGAPSPLAELPLQMADLALRQRAELQGSVLERELAWWKAELAGAPAALDLPTDRPRPPLQSHAGARLSVALGPERAARLRVLARARGATTFHTLLALWQVVLARFAGQDDLVLGTSVAGRARADTEPLIGFLVNAVPLRGAYDGAAPFTEHLARARDTALSALEHAELPFERLVLALRPPRDLARQPVFQVTLDLLNVPAAPLALAGLALETVELETGRAKFDLSILVTDDASLACSLEYATDLFDAASVRRLWDAFVVLAGAALAAPETPCGALPLLDAAGQAAVRAASDGGTAPWPAEALLHELVAGDPLAVAVSGPGFSLTYEELERRANHLAHLLRARGVGPEVTAAVCLGRTAELVPALLAVLKAGGAYVPLDPGYPPARLARLAADARPAVFLADALTAPLLPAGAPVLRVDREPGARADAPACTAGPESLAYVLYTSGSTGAPKGVQVPHRAVVHYVDTARRLYRVEQGAGAPLASSISFDLTLTSLFPVLAAGRTVLLAGEGPGIEPLAESARLHPGQSLVKLTPSHLRALAAELRPAEAAAWTRAFVVGGEALLHEDLAFWRAAAPDTAIVNEYGPTEATVGCIVHTVGDGDPERGPVAIGRPFPNVRAYIVDARGELCPFGAPGELVLAGPCIARGYHGRAEATAERFLDDPFPPETEGSGERAYRTGDRARLCADGTFVFLGRSDGQLKVRGHRVEPAEVEAALRRAGARAAAVGLAGGRLVAWVEAAPERARGMRAALAAELPEAYVPGAVVALDALPLNAHGKVDFGRLPPPSDVGADIGDEPARGAAEEALAEVVAGVLGLARVGRHDDFFGLGGDSILSLSVVARAAERGLALRTRDVFEHPTVARLAAVAGAARPGEDEGPLAGPVPLLPAQRWLLERQLAAPGHWNQTLVFEARAGLAPETLERAVLFLTAQHDALRTRFERGADGAWRAHVVPAEEVAFERAHGEPDAAALARSQAGFDLARGPLQRVTWLERGPGEPALVVWAIHHLLVDGVSWRILLADLARVVDALEAGRAPALPPRTASVRAYAEQAPDAVEGAPPPHPMGTEGESAVLRTELEPALGALLLGSAPRAFRATAEDVLVAALGSALADEAGAAGAWIDVEGHGREGELDLARTVGWLTSIRPVHVSAGADAARVLKTAKEALRAERAGGGVRTTGGVLFNYLGRTDTGGEAGAPLTPLERDPGPDKGPVNARSHALELDARASGGRVVLRWRASPALWSAEGLRKLSQALAASARALLAACAPPGAARLTPSDVPLAGLEQAELDALGAGVEDVVPLTPTQQGMLFHSLYAPGSAAYLEQLANVMEGPLDARALRAAFESLAADVELLRARVLLRDGAEPMLAIEQAPRLPWEERDWRAETPAAARERLSALCAEERAAGFDLARAPLYRLVLARLPAERHALVFTYHHLVLDGWSMPLVLARVLAAYLRGGRADEARAPLPPWRGYVAWLLAQDKEAARAFWRARLAGFARRTPVGPRPDAPEAGTYGERELYLERAETARLTELARARGATVSTLVQAAWALVLARTSGERDVLFGVTVAGRPPELGRVEERIGLFINTLPVRVSVDDGARVADWLRELQARRAEEQAFEWTPLPLSQACADVPPGAKLFDSLVVFENYPLDDALRSPPGGLRVAETLAYERTSYPATLVCVPGASLTLRLLHDEARLSAPEAARLLQSMRAALRGLAAEVEGRVGDVAVLAPDERQDLLYELAAGPPGPRDAPLAHRAVLARAALQPGRAALEQAGAVWSYGELAQRVERLAARLTARGVGPEVVVGVQLERSPEHAAALLAVLRAGGAFLPLDPEHPAARRAFQVQDAGARLVLARAADGAELAGVPLLPVDRDEDGELAPAFDAARADTLAYVLYTSGSSGAPKGVAVEHRALAHYTAVAAETYDLGPGDRALALAALAFDTSLEELFPSLARGATVVLREPDDLASPAAFARLVEQRRITLLNFPTALWHELVQGFDAADAARLAGVRGVILGGEAVRPGPLARWRALCGARARLWNTYGPTEATIVSTVHDLTAPAGVPERPPIGRPIAGARAYVVDGAGRLVPRGYAGELALAGPGVARGYAGRPELTQERFPADLFPGAEPAGRLYLTGDRARWTEEGVLEFLGRGDLQVKVRGQRVELGEVEAALAAHPGVAEAVALAVTGEDGRTALHAWAVPRAGAEPDEEALRAHLAARLPSAAVPARIGLRAALPRTATGKLDRAALAAPGSAPARQAGYVAPRTAEEAALAALFAEALGVERVGAHDDFFALGGDSLLAVRLLGLVRRALGRDLPLRELFEGPTPAALARALAGQGAEPRAALDLAAETQLPADVRPGAGAPLDPPRRILVTGATGFLGAHLLAAFSELLPPGAELVALVRAPDAPQARARLDAVLARYDLARPELARRLAVVAGDLAAPRLGLDAATWERLAGELDAIVHAGAEVGFLKPYGLLKPANVGGTLAALRLASAGRPKAFHHVSTAGVFDVEAPPAVLTEELGLAPFAGVRGGYAQSKWVAEELVRAAQGRGLAARIFRPGRLVASARTGAANAGDMALELLAACLALGLVPDLDLEVDATPVDHAARALAQLALDPRAALGTFHLVHSARFTAAESAAALSAGGQPVALAPPDAWWSALQDLAARDPGGRFAPLVLLLAGVPELAGRASAPAPRVDDRRAQALLAPAGIVCPPLDAAWLARVARRLDRIG